MSELEKRPWHYARDYLQADANRKEAVRIGLVEAAERHRQAMQQIWDSIPEHLLDMVKTHVSNERAKEQMK